MLFSLLTVCQLIIDIAGELSARRGQRFEDYTEAIRNLAADERFPGSLVRDLERLPGFRNVLIHEYVALDMRRVVDALESLGPVEQFLEIVRRIEDRRSEHRRGKLEVAGTRPVVAAETDGSSAAALAQGVVHRLDDQGDVDRRSAGNALRARCGWCLPRAMLTSVMSSSTVPVPF